MAGLAAAGGDTWRWIAIAAVLVAWFLLRRWLRRPRTRSAQYGEAEADRAVLEQLRRDGVDLTRPRTIEFFLYFPSREAAESAGHALREDGFTIGEAGERSEEQKWLVLATRTMAPELAALTEARRVLDVVAGRYGGEYDGWGTPTG